MKNELSEDNLSQIIVDDDSITPSIIEAINEAQVNNEIEKKSFVISFNAYTQVNKYVNLLLKEFYITKLLLKLVRFNLVLVNSRKISYADESLNKVNDLICEFNKNKELLNRTKKALDLLEYNKTSVCNYEICLLLLQIYNKLNLLLDEFNDYLHTIKNEMQCITYISNSDYAQDLENLNESINYFVLKLDLNNDKLSGSK